MCFHTHVDTPRGRFAIVPETDLVIPLHVVANDHVLRPEGHWTPSALENVLGQPCAYTSRTVRLFVVLPELTVADLSVPELVAMLKEYAQAHDLNIKLTYYTGPKSSKEYINARTDYIRPQRRVSIDIATREIVDYLTQHGDAGRMLLTDMHLSPGWDYSMPHGSTSFDMHALFTNCNLHFERNAEYDYNTVVVHDYADRQHNQTQYAINVPRCR